jgi:indolepyruvate ferredoxin oxidoreductase
LELDEVDPATLKAILALPEKIRGYGYVKERHHRSTRLEHKQLLAKLTAEPEAIKIFDPQAA